MARVRPYAQAIGVWYHISVKVALVYDRVNKWGGAERVVIALRKIFPDAPLFTSVYKEDQASWAKKIQVIPSFLQKVPFASQHHEAFGALMPVAFESFNFDEFDLVISVTSESAKGIITKPETRHVCICLTPTRYLWSGYRDYFSNPLFRIVTLPVVSYLRLWDKIAAYRPDQFIAISNTVRNRIKKYYGLESEVIHPPLMMRPTIGRLKIKDGRLKNKNHQSYYLVVSRLVPYKRVDLAIRAANKLKIPLKIIGTGNEFGRLKQMAGPTVEFLEYVSDPDLKYYYANCRALIFPGVEDFGLAMVEAQAFGKPVIAYRGGGAEEIVVEKKTGEFFDAQNASSLVQVLKKFRSTRYNSMDCKRNARRFSYSQFEKKIKNLINDNHYS